MVSAAEQLAASLNFGALAKAEELKKRIYFTVGALLVYRLGTYIPLPGIDPNAWEQIFNTQAGGSVKILAPAKEVDAEPKGKNKRMALEAAKGGDKPKGGKPKVEAAEGESKPAE